MSTYPSDTPGSDRRIRFVTLCQQLLALAVVVAVLTPAARTVTMDVRPMQPVEVGTSDVSLRAAEFPSKVPTGEVSTEVDQYALTAPDGKGKARLRGTEKDVAGGGEAIVSDVLPVDGYGTVGVTWAASADVDEDGIGVKVRTQTNGEWSGWTEAEYHDDHGPDPRSEEGKHTRPGTDALLVGNVDAVQVKVATDDAAPVDMKVAVIDPGTAKATATQKPAIDTARASTDGAEPADPAVPVTDGDDPAATGDEIALQAATATIRPKIYSRAQWGANESLRDKSSLSYYEVHGGFVHHTVNANNYTADQVPGIIRGIYSYHVKTRGWSDIGYNFLVDKFGRIWEGRAGGVDRPVVGAHTQGYNNYSFAMSAIGNFDVTGPPSAMLKAYGALFAWKLALHGVDAADMSQKIGSKYFPAINGHRDAGSTACPGRYLYAKIPTIRSLADAAQKPFASREAEGNFAGSDVNDLLVRRASDGRLYVLTLDSPEGVWQVRSRVDTGVNIASASSIYKAGDWDQDGFADMITRRKSDGLLQIYRGKGGARFHPPQVLSGQVKDATLIALPGDVTGDGYPDLMAQSGGAMRIWRGRGAAGLGTSLNNLGTSVVAYSAVNGYAHVPAGLMNADGAPDSIVRVGSEVRLYTGNGPGGWTSVRTLEVTAGSYDWLLGVGRLGANAQPDFVARDKATGGLFILAGTTNGWTNKIPLGRFLGWDLAA
ncbi:N-acetylmuramoyl-L-alanine amidase [Nocardioides sp. CPCC 206347]|uniref:N-acetylmuramoyl-L-alanine amidase n=1 Tax=Nocardioides sp. CPCC 206347 TaxID=3406463 RepID=UPI003B43CE23